MTERGVLIEDGDDHQDDVVGDDPKIECWVAGKEKQKERGYRGQQTRQE